MDWLRSRHDLDDERVLIGVTAGVLWLLGTIAAVLAQLMPGSPQVEPHWFAGLAVGVVAYGLWSISGVFDWSRVSVGGWARKRIISAVLNLSTIASASAWVSWRRCRRSVSIMGKLEKSKIAFM